MNTMHCRVLTVLCTLLTFALAPRAHAWHDEGHVYAALAGTRGLPAEVPAFFRDGERTIAHASLDPDLMRDDELPQLRAAEYPEHYFDWEWLDVEEALPEHRYVLIALCAERDVPIGRLGFLPYALAEATQRLTVAFAEHRRDPDNEHVRMKCLVYAGRLAHYAADLHQPLHTTVHFNGRADEDFQSPGSGIHAKVDALPTKVPYAELFDQPPSRPEAHDEVFELVERELRASHALVDRVYELEEQLPVRDDLGALPEPVRAFTAERMRAAARLIAALQLSAWRKSAEIELPHWLERATFDEGFDESRVPPQPHGEE
ncbi:MAG: hypothetical protein ACODAQ_07720 [Phycisphaeraceae bacterium]